MKRSSRLDIQALYQRIQCATRPTAGSTSSTEVYGRCRVAVYKVFKSDDITISVLLGRWFSLRGAQTEGTAVR
eukprot:1910489-Pyramimonas_sp.AAC.1